ncbi:hypothetical protein BSR28_05880 [Boudabousia liubingyangii]|uniref:hypothetical protein n=1 Tax=Boudabousia liubingyangii TaxID=1921764 RepID=UPI00093D8EFB|nr:hypothetical protein [Boudabousia liubingyangii]OKL46949.1 hypothetical protein BSR28_05880 [Boudabousia liubingyangii]
MSEKLCQIHFPEVAPKTKLFKRASGRSKLVARLQFNRGAFQEAYPAISKETRAKTCTCDYQFIELINTSYSAWIAWLKAIVALVIISILILALGAYLENPPLAIFGFFTAITTFFALVFMVVGNLMSAHKLVMALDKKGISVIQSVESFSLGFPDTDRWFFNLWEDVGIIDFRTSPEPQLVLQSVFFEANENADHEQSIIPTKQLIDLDPNQFHQLILEMQAAAVPQKAAAYEASFKEPPREWTEILQDSEHFFTNAVIN